MIFLPYLIHAKKFKTLFHLLMSSLTINMKSTIFIFCFQFKSNLFYPMTNPLNLFQDESPNLHYKSYIHTFLHFTLPLCVILDTYSTAGQSTERTFRMKRIVKDPQERRLEIIKTAGELFRSKEYDKTTMQDVVNAVGIAKGTVYYYFSSKEDLLEAVVEDMVSEASQRMETLVTEAEGNALEKLAHLIRMSNITENNEDLMETLHQPGNSGMHARLLAAAIIKQAPLYAALVCQGCEEGIFHTENPLEASEFILSGVQFLTDSGIHPWSAEDLQRRALALPGLIEALLKAPAGSFNFMLEQG